MSKVDDELSRRFQRAARPLDEADLFEGVARRRRRRRALQRLEAGALAVAVVGATAGGFLALKAAFPENDARNVGDAPLTDNGLVVFEREGARERSHLFTAQQDGSDVRQLTDLASSDSTPSVSPDGRTVAFVHQPEGREPVLATIPIDGGTVEVLTGPELFVTSGVSWSPDGAHIAFTAHDGHGQRLFVIDAHGGDPRALTGDDLHWASSPSWSPDGELIAFTANVSDASPEGTWDIFTIRPDGARVQNVTGTPSVATDEANATWSPDGDSIAFSRSTAQGADIVVRRIADGSERVLTHGYLDGGPAWSPDGTVIAFHRTPVDGGDTQLWTIRPDGTDLSRLAIEGVNPAWQPVAARSTITPEPSHAAEGVDVGLGFNLCGAERLGGIDFRGHGSDGEAWVGVSSRSDGTCPSGSGPGEYVAAADEDGDGRAEAFVQLPWECSIDCVPYDSFDFERNGTEELIVASPFSITSYFVLTYLAPPGQPSPALVPIVVGRLDHPPAGLHAGEPLRIDAGGDAGYSSEILCEPPSFLIWTWAYAPVDSEGPTERHYVEIEIDGTEALVGGRVDTTVPAGEPTGVGDDIEPSCGVDWHPAA